MSWNEVVLTKVGEELIAGMLGGAKLTITRAEIGDTAVDEEILPEQTAVFSPISAPALIRGQGIVESGNGTRIDIQIRNDGVTETSRMKQIGIFAKTESHEEIMLGILQDDVGEEIPAYNDFPEWLISLSVIIGISRTNNIVVNVNPHVFVTLEDFNVLKEQLSALLAESNCHHREIARRFRDPTKPDYGIGGGDAAGITLITAEHTGNADVTVVIDGKEYDGKNISRRAEDAPSGTLIIKEEQ